MIKLNKSIIIIAIALFSLIMIQTAFAVDNETVLNEDLGNDTSFVSVSLDSDVLKASNDYYFDASAEKDGDGSQANPYKYLTADRIKANANIYLADGEYQLDTSKNIEKVNIYGSNVDKTIIEYYGVGFRVSSFLTVQNVTFTDMSIINYGNVTANNTVFSYGSGSSYDSYGNNFGGAIYSHEDYSNAHVTIDNCTFKDNFAIYGGAIYMGNGYLDVINSVFESNRAYNYGGAIACENARSVSVSKSKFYNSIAMGDAGGAIYLRSTTFTGKNIDFINSSATFGSAITSLKTKVSLSLLNCENNTAEWNGGAIYHFYGDFSLTNSKFTNNSARNGGAVYVDNSTSLFIRANIFKDNVALHTAGAVYSILNKLIYPIAGYNTFINNQAYYMNDVFDTSDINLTVGSGNYTMYKVQPTDIDVLPSRYSLVEEGYVTEVKDQQIGGNCWAFTAMAVVESCILKAGGNALDLSEENMKNLMAAYSDYGWKLDPNEGGYDYMQWGYLVSWLGPILEQTDLIDDKSALSPIFNSILHIQNLLFLKRDNFTDNDAIKRAIMQYGAVATSIAYYNSYLDSINYYCYSSMPCNHAVTIVGWDDNYSKSNFKWGANIGDGAWIVKNSWGPSWGNDGYFYVSYYDMNFAKPGSKDASYTIIFNDTIKYDKNYQYDVPGMSDYFINSTPFVWYKNVFKASDDEYLAAVSTYFEKVTDWEVSIYVNDELLLVREGQSKPGYFTIDLNQLIPLKKGDEFAVVFNINVDGEAAFPISERMQFNKLLYGPEISFVSYDGENWQDLYDLPWAYSSHSYSSQVACIKAFTVLNEISTSLDLTVDFEGLNPANITAVVHDQYGNLLKSGVVIFNVNEADHWVDVKNGIAVLPYYFTETQNNIYAVFNSDGYVSSMNYTTLSFDKLGLTFDFNVERTLNNVTLDIIANDKINEDVLVYINGEEYSVELVDGRYTLSLFNLENGIYNISVKTNFPQDSIYINTVSNGSFIIDIRNTEISADNLTITDEDEIGYNIYLFDENNNPIANRTLEVILDGITYNVTTDDNGQTVLPIKLNAGQYAVNINFNGDNDYLKSSSVGYVNVKSKVEISLDVNRYSNNVNLTVNVSKHINDTVIIVINNKTENVEVVNGIATLELNNLENNVYEVGIYLDDSKYVFDEFSSSFTVNVKNTQIISSDLIITDEDEFNYTIMLLDEFGNPLLNKSIDLELSGKSYNMLTDNNGQAIIPIKLNPGTYASTFRFNGDSDYFSSQNSTTIQIKTKVSIGLAIEKSGNDVLLKINLSKKLTGFLTLTVNGQNHTLKFINGIVNYQLSDLDNGIYNVSISLDNPNYLADEFSDSFTINIHRTVILADDLTITDENPILYNITLVDDAGNPISNRYVSVMLNENVLDYVTDVDGRVAIPVNLSSGVYRLEAAFKGDDAFLKSSNSSIIIVKTKIDIEIGIDRNVNNVSLAIDLSKPINDTLTVVLNNESYSLNVTNGTALLNLNDLENGIYNVRIELDDSDYVYDDVTGQFIVDVKNTQIMADDLTIAENDSGIFNVALVDEFGNALANRSIEITVNNESYSVFTDENGHASISLNLSPGKYDVESKFEGDNDYFKSVSANVVNVKAVIDVSVSYYASSDDYIIELNSSNPMNETLLVKVNNESYYVTINNNTNKITLNKLSDGIYNVSISLVDSDKFAFENIYSNFTISTKHSRIVSDDAVSYNNVETDYSIILTDYDGNVLPNKNVTFIIGDNNIQALTNDQGIASISIRLPTGNYDVSISYSGDIYEYYGCESAQKISVKPTIIANDSTTKTYSSKYAVKFLDGSGNPLANSDISVVLGNDQYLKTTDENGYIYIDILQKPGNYTLSATNPINNETLTENINVLARIIQNKDLTMYEYGGNCYTVRVLDDNGNIAKAGEIVEMKIKNTIHKVKVGNDGLASLKINLKNGKYSVTATYKGYSVSNKITVKQVLIAKKITVKKGKKIKYQAKLLNNKGKALKGKKITFKIKGKKYTAKTNSKGFATVTIKLKFKVGSYNVYCTYGKSKDMGKIKIKK